MKIIRLFTLLVCVLAVQPSFAAGTLDNAQRLLKEGRVERALREVKSYQLGNPNDPQAAFLKGAIFAKLGEEEAAIELFEELTNNYPELPEPFNNLAVLYAKRGQYKLARQKLEGAITTHPSYATAHENLGHIYTILAASAYNKALALDSSNPSLQSKLEMLHKLSSLPGVKTHSQPLATTQKAISPAVNTTGTRTVPFPSTKKPVPVVSKPIAVAPPASKANSGAADKKAVAALIESWASAWQQGNIDTYLASYAPNFEPANGLSLSNWQNQRRKRVAGRKIQLKITNQKIDFTAPNVALATFDQAYRSSTYSDEVFKYMVLEKLNGKWHIAQEQTIQ